MALYSFDWQYPQTEKPKNEFGIELTDEQIKETKWMIVDNMPEPLDWHSVGWERYKGWVQSSKPKQPYPSWIKNETNTDWIAPVARPNDGKNYSWDESTTSWVEVQT